MQHSDPTFLSFLRKLRYIEETDHLPERIHAGRELRQEIRIRLQEIDHRRAETGSPSLLQGIATSGWCGLSRALRRASTSMVWTDALAWLLSLLALLNLPLLLLLAGCVLLAHMLRFASTQLCQAVLVDATSVRRTRRRHVLAGITGLVMAGVGLLLYFLAAAAPTEAVPLVLSLGRIPVALINFGLPIAAGAFASLATYLDLPLEYLRLERTAELLRRILDRLDELLPPPAPSPARPSYAIPILLPFLLLLAAPTSGVGADDATCAVLVDGTVSLRQDHRSLATDFLVSSARELVAALGCSSITAGTFTDAGPFEPRSWIPVPALPAPSECDSSKPPPLEGAAGILYGALRNVQEYRQRDRMEGCKRASAQAQSEYEQQYAGFLDQLRSAITVDRPRRNGSTRITPLLRSLLTLQTLRAVVLVTDGVEAPEPAQSPLLVPAHVSVVMLVGAADPEFHSEQEVLAAASRWTKIPGITVALTTEVHPGMWSQLAHAGRHDRAR